MNLPDIQAADVAGKTVLVRLDTDVPVENGVIVDSSRLKAGLPTIRSILEKGGKVIVLGHLGRPEGKIVPKLSLRPVAEWFEEEIKNQKSNLKNTNRAGFDGWEITENLSVLENLRFSPGEEENDPEYAKKLAGLGQIYCNDAFAVAHRAHCSTVGIAKLLPHFAGIRIQEEIAVLSNLLESPKRPMVVVIGGAKIETKLPLINKMEEIADQVLVGGKIAQEYKNEQHNPKIRVATLTADGSDLTEESVADFLSIIQSCATVVWNGPVGIINEKFLNSGLHSESSEKGTRMLAEGIAQSSAYKVIGGGDTVEFIERIGLTKRFDFVSTGGGAMLAFLSGEKLPGLEALAQ